MKKTLTLLALWGLIPFFTLAQSKVEEPSLNIEVQINGEKHLVKDGESIEIDGKEIMVKTSDFKTFDFGVLSFDYPKYFAFEYEEDFAYKSLTLDGNNFVIMYFEIGAEAELDLFIKEMVKNFGKKNCKISDREIQVGEVTLTGKRIDIDLMGQKLTYDLYKLESDDFKTHMISFQDSKNDDGSDSDESNEIFKILGETIELK